MPLFKSKDGSWQFGEHGKKYKKREDAAKQGRAIKADQSRRKKGKK